jgi:antitoxin ParD1/3/4
MKAEQNDTLTSMSISVLTSQKSYVEERAVSEGYATPSEYMRQLIREDQKRKEQEKLEAMLLKALERGERIEVTPEYWARKRADLKARYGGKAKK